MDYDPMVMDTESAGPQVKISEVYRSRGIAFYMTLKLMRFLLGCTA
jgi:hypothetical protein